MKKWLITSILFISNFALAQPTRDITTYEFAQFLQSPWSSKISDEFKDQPLEALTIVKNQIHFKLKGFPIYIEWVGGQEVVLRVNGKDFSKSDLRTYKSTRQHLVQKFDLKKPIYSLLDWFMPKAYSAIVTADIPESEIMRLRSQGYNVQLGTVAQNQTYPDMQSLLNAVGPNQMNGYLAVIAAFLGGSQQIMNSSGFQNIFNNNTGTTIEPFRLNSSQ